MSWRPLAAAVAGGGALVVLTLRHPLAGVAAAPAVAMATTLLAVLLPHHPWRGATPLVTWVAGGRRTVCCAALLLPCSAAIAVPLPALVLSLPASALPACLLYLGAGVLFAAGLALHAPTGIAATARTAAAVVVLYGGPLYLLMVAELFADPTRGIAAALFLWPPAVAAALTQIDLARLPWPYAHLPLAYYPYHYPAAPWAALPLGLAALALHLTLWHHPRRGWRTNLEGDATRPPRHPAHGRVASPPVDGGPPPAIRPSGASRSRRPFLEGDATRPPRHPAHGRVASPPVDGGPTPAIRPSGASRSRRPFLEGDATRPPRHLPPLRLATPEAAGGL
ncbi:MAG: hypothetical protein GW783_01475 [Deltaproteobacteria bacterium]|nr:hypothetical protein [Deltaproteobacteria bacterium]